jgi:hypothetical protein
MCHDRYTHNSMEIKSIEAVNITGRDTGEKLYQTELRSHIHGITLVTELHLLNYWTLSTKQLIQIIQIQIICMHIMHKWFMLNCG